MRIFTFAEALKELAPQSSWKIDAPYAYENIEWFDEENTIPSEAALQAKTDELNAAQPLVELREERNKRLAETDWWALSDITMTDEERAYREALRDLPANTSDPANPVWPTKPT